MSSLVSRHYSLLDQCLINFDKSLQTLFAESVANRTNPANEVPESALTVAERRHSAGLMRINHAGEISAQALYQAQALTAKSKHVRISMQQSAQEENDHLAWCKERLHELNAPISYLNPLWYLGSFAIGTVAGLAGDAWSLGFVAETERQVVKHLQSHLNELPKSDMKSRSIIKQMQEDEAHHGTVAMTAGAAELPNIIKIGMRLFSKIMTKTAYWI